MTSKMASAWLHGQIWSWPPQMAQDGPKMAKHGRVKSEKIAAITVGFLSIERASTTRTASTWPSTCSRTNRCTNARFSHHSFIINHSSFIIHHSSFIIYHLSFIIHHSSFIIHHASFIPFSSFIIHPLSFIIHHSSFIFHHSSCSSFIIHDS